MVVPLATSTHTGAGEPVEVYDAGSVGVPDCCRTSTWVCFLIGGSSTRRRYQYSLQSMGILMDVVFERVAGRDIGKNTVTVCARTPAPGGGRQGETRTFRTMTRSLELMRDWLVGQGVKPVAMESTSSCWKPVFYALEGRMECWLLDAAPMKAVPGLKTDVKDSEWIAQLLKHGLLRPSFVPPPPIRRLRLLTRYRVQLMGDRSRDAGRLEKMLEDARIKISSVASSVITV